MSDDDDFSGFASTTKLPSSDLEFAAFPSSQTTPTEQKTRDDEFFENVKRKSKNVQKIR